MKQKKAEWVLFVTSVGSHLWGMNTQESDLDVFKVFVVPTRDFLAGTANVKSRFERIPPLTEIIEGYQLRSDLPCDIASHEVGTVINQLLKGNINFICGVMSPIVLFQHSFNWDPKKLYAKSPFSLQAEIEKLRSIVVETISKNCYNSIKGMADANYRKYIISGVDQSEHRCNTIARAVKFGIELLSSGNFVFSAVENTLPTDIPILISALDIAYKKSKLPEQPDEKKYRDWLYEVRIHRDEQFEG
jgi:predicted nucleotidyltransferase